MVRFARAKGSKGANIKLPEEATPWQEMKQQMLESQENKVVRPIQRFYFNKDECDTSKETTWAKFEETGPDKNAKRSLPIKEVRKFAKKIRKTTNETSNTASEKIDSENFSNGGKFVRVRGNLSNKSETEECEYPSSVGNPRKQQFMTRREKEQAGLPPTRRKPEKQNKNEFQAMYIGNQELPSEKIDSEYFSNGRKFVRVRENMSNKSETDGCEYPSSVKNPRKQQSMTRYEKEQVGLPPTRRKPEKQNKNEFQTMYIGNREFEVRRFDGYIVKKEDWERLIELRKKLKEENVDEDVLKATLKLERRRAEKSLANERKKVCFKCRQPGHMISNCPDLEDYPSRKTNDIPDSANTGLCFKCGSTEHTHFECKVVRDNTFKFATCFVCNEGGHIARQCPDNPQGLYPKGGGCSICGEVTHLRKHCPTSQKEKPDFAMTLPTLKNDDALEALDVESKPVKQPKTPMKKNVVKF